MGDGDRLIRQLGRPRRPRATAWSWPPTARARPPAWPASSGEGGVALTVVEDGGADPGRRRRPGSIVVQPLERGFVLPEVKLAVLAEADVTGRRRAHRAPRPRRTDAQGFFDDLKPGDYVVHHQHGVGRYGGMVKRAIGGVERDYLLLEYRGGDKLYVPSDQIDAVRHYTGGDTPTLNRLGGREWATDQGQGAGRGPGDRPGAGRPLPDAGSAPPGHAFPPDTPWQQRAGGGLPLPGDARPAAGHRATSRPTWRTTSPMDRLVCGDVGFGKTEVAIRAAFKAVQDGKQVAVLVPTTLLAQQHFRPSPSASPATRCGSRSLSRFLTPGAGQAGGRRAWPTAAVDVVIGTHRLLSDDIKFKDLGLLVVDEEQRFGVTHKEAIKKLRANVDVLTLTATPIPRTLEMSLTGIRDLTMLNTPPAERQPILTYVGEYDERAVAEAIRRELLREGQVFFVHNRVQDIEPGGRAAARAGARGPRRRRPRPDGRGHARAGRPRLLGGPVRRARLHHDHRVGHRHAHGEHPRRRPGRPAGPGPAPPAAGPGRPGRAAGLRLPVLPPRAAAVGEGLRAAEDHRRAHRAGVGLQDRHARPRDPGRRQPAGRQPVRPHRRRRLRPLRARW